MKSIFNYLFNLFTKTNPQVNEYPIINRGMTPSILGGVFIALGLLILGNPEEFNSTIGRLLDAPADFWEYIKSTPESLIGMSAEEIDALNNPDKKDE